MSSLRVPVMRPGTVMWVNQTAETGVCVVAPVAAFSANTTSGIAPLAVQFTDSSTNTPTDWDWYIDDTKISDLQSLEYTFSTPGIYDVSLYAANGASGDWENKSAYITVTSGLAGICEWPTGNLTPVLSQVSDTTLGYSLSLADNLTAISFDGLFELAFDNTTDSIVFNNLQPSTWHRFKIYNETEWGMLNCTTNATPVTPTPLPVMPSTDSMGGINFAAYWWLLPVLGAVVLLFKRF
jgi:PKD repeat protein